MSQSVFRRIVAAVALAALVSAGPAQAAVRWEAPAAGNVLVRAWQWLAGFLPGAPEKDAGTITKESAVDPGGATASSGPAVCASPAEVERGGCIDPNG